VLRTIFSVAGCSESETHCSKVENALHLRYSLEMYLQVAYAKQLTTYIIWPPEPEVVGSTPAGRKSLYIKEIDRNQKHSVDADNVPTALY
jgi:hypothetical protein